MLSSDDNPTFPAHGAPAAAKARRNRPPPVAVAARLAIVAAAALLFALEGGLATAADGAAVAVGGAQSLEAIARQAEATVRSALPGTLDPLAPKATQRIVARPPDPRLRLMPCKGALQGTLPAGAASLRGRGMVQVACAGPVRWSVLVPVSIETEIEALVSRRNLPRGAVPAAGDFEPRRMLLPGFADIYVTNLDAIAGSQLARPLASGTPLTRDALATGPVVRRGEAVTLVTSVGGLQVRAPGLALQDARPGDRVRVQNVNSLKVVEGRADKQGMIEVDR